MNCRQCADLIGDAVDSTLSPEQNALLQEHCRGCEDCRELLDDLMKIRAVAATLERRIPPPTLWSAIATNTTKVTPRRSIWRGPQRGSRAGDPIARNLRDRVAVGVPWVPLAAAAALIVMAGTAAIFDIGPLRRRNPAVESTAELARSAASELQQAELHYVNAITALEQLTANKERSLDPLIADEIDQSLNTINRAIGDSRTALKTDPNSLVAQTSLLEALRMKVALLQETVSLISQAEREATATLPKS